MSDTYGDVDASTDVVGAVAWQERIDEWPAIKAYKNRLDRLCAFGPLIDVGAGPGVDAWRTGAVGIDRSFAMARQARQRTVPYVIGDIHQLPVGSRLAGSVRCDRVLQHLSDPDAALRELARCLRPGGRIAVADPDQQTLTIEVPGVADSLIHRVRHLRRDIGYRSGTYVSRLPAMMTACGLTEITVDPFPLELRNSDDAFGIATWVAAWGASRGFTEEEAREWSHAVRSSSGRGFRYALTYYVVSGVCP